MALVYLWDDSLFSTSANKSCLTIYANFIMKWPKMIKAQFFFPKSVWELGYYFYNSQCCFYVITYDVQLVLKTPGRLGTQSANARFCKKSTRWMSHLQDVAKQLMCQRSKLSTCVLSVDCGVGQIVVLAAPQVVVSHLWWLVPVHGLREHDPSTLDEPANNTRHSHKTTLFIHGEAQSISIGNNIVF